MMKSIIQFHIHKGITHYVAEGIDIPVVTQGKTLDELVENLNEAIALQLEGENLADFSLNSKPTVLMNIEIPSPVHA